MGPSLSQPVLLTPAEGLCDRTGSPPPPAVTSLPHHSPTGQHAGVHTQTLCPLLPQVLMAHPKHTAKSTASMVPS